MNDQYAGASRRIYNIGGHGGTLNPQGSINQRILDDLNDSMNGRKFDNNFDYSHDNIENFNHNSSRLNHSSGIGEIPLIKRSETEQQIRGVTTVTFAETHNVRNHPLHIKSSGGGPLAKIDERKSQSGNRKSGGGQTSTGRSQSNKKGG